MIYTPLVSEYFVALSGCHLMLPDSFSLNDKYLLYTLCPDTLKIDIKLFLLLGTLNGITT